MKQRKEMTRGRRTIDRLLLILAAVGSISLLVLAIHFWYGVLGITKEQEAGFLVLLAFLPKVMDAVLSRRSRKQVGEPR